MKVVTSQEMARIESLAYQEGTSEEAFMEEAGKGVALTVEKFIEDHHLDKMVILLCGKGNNAGDAYVAGRHLRAMKYGVVAIQCVPIEECSPLCQLNHKRFIEETKCPVHDVLGSLPSYGVIVDGLFGTGFHGEISGVMASAVNTANESGLPIIAIDIPSGVDGNTGEVQGPAIEACKTVFLGLPKNGFFLRDGWDHVGHLRYVDFGLDQKFIAQAKEEFVFLDQPPMPKPKRSRHKYEAGLVVALAGSPGMPGAAMLATFAALRGGAGIVRLLHPQGMEKELSSSLYELIKIPYDISDHDAVVKALGQGGATLIGPGIGRSESTKNLLKAVLAKIDTPSVLDADALTIIAEAELPIPKNAILTPHRGEMHRLLGLTTKEPLDQQFLNRCQQFVEKNNTILILKGGPTFIFSPGESITVCPRGDWGMATAGSGDVLTGLLAALLAQGLSPREAAMLGVYLHGVAGECAAEAKTSYCMIASDIIEGLPEAFREGCF